MISGINHPKMFDRKTKGSIIVTGIPLVNSYLKILLLSLKNELLSDPNYGCTLKSLVFSPNDEILSDMVKDSIVEAIRLYADSIIVRFEDITITQDDDKISISINYKFSDTYSNSKLLLEILNSEVIG